MKKLLILIAISLLTACATQSQSHHIIQTSKEGGAITVSPPAQPDFPANNYNQSSPMDTAAKMISPITH
jgi:hypothetical protein